MNKCYNFYITRGQPILKPIKAFVLLILAVVLSAGASSCENSTVDTAKPLPDVERIKVLPLNEQELLLRAAPQDLIQLYFRALNEKKVELAIACMDRDFIGTKKAEIVQYWTQNYKSVNIVKIELPDDLKERQTPQSAVYQVTYRLELQSDTAGAESEGDNIRYFHVEKKAGSDRWTLTGMGTSP